MFILSPLIFRFASNNFVPDCPLDADYESCGINHGYQEIGIGAAVAAIWLLGAIILLINGIFKYIKSEA